MLFIDLIFIKNSITLQLQNIYYEFRIQWDG